MLPRPPPSHSQSLRRRASSHDSEFDRLSSLAASIDAGSQNRAVSAASHLKNRFQQTAKSLIPGAVNRWTDYVTEHAAFEGGEVFTYILLDVHVDADTDIQTHSHTRNYTHTRSRVYTNAFSHSHERTEIPSKRCQTGVLLSISGFFFTKFESVKKLGI